MEQERRHEHGGGMAISMVCVAAGGGMRHERRHGCVGGGGGMRMKEEWGTEMGGGCDGWPPPVFRGIIWFVVSLVDYQTKSLENHRRSYDICEMMSPTPMLVFV